MKRIFTYHINKKDDGKTITEYLHDRGFSHHIQTHLKRTENGICKNGIWSRVSDRLQENDRLDILLTEDTASETIVPVEMPLDIVYEDEDLLVVNKPADCPIHPSVNNFENTLANGIAWYYHKQGIPFVYRCINRLDRDTTGLLIIAKNMLSASLLSGMLLSRQIHREYLAVVCGELPKSGTIDAPIARAEASLVERCVDFAHGEHAVTHFTRLDTDPVNGYSLAAITLETGRTHQIRVHMNYLGYPLPGDYLYHPDFRHFSHQALHSHRLQFPHPITGELLSFEAPPPWSWPVK